MSTHRRTCKIGACEPSCGVEIEVEGDRLAAIRPNPEHPITKGCVCIKGMHVPDYVNHPSGCSPDGAGLGDAEPEDAAERGIADSQRVRSETGELAIPARLTADVRRGAVAVSPRGTRTRAVTRAEVAAYGLVGQPHEGARAGVPCSAAGEAMGPLENAMEEGRAPEDLREGVRSGILASLQRDIDQRGGRTARLLASAGLIGIAGAVGAILLISGHPFDHHPPWHVVVFASVWAGLLVVSLSIAFLHVRTPSLPLARAACVGVLGLGLAGVCGAACPDQHFLHWWTDTAIGARIGALGGDALSALCFGGVTTLVFGLVASFVVLGGRGRPKVRPLLPALMLLLLLSPGIALQSVGTPWGVLLGWLAGTAAGAYLGVAGGTHLRAAFATLER